MLIILVISSVLKVLILLVFSASLVRDVRDGNTIKKSTY